MFGNLVRNRSMTALAQMRQMLGLLPRFGLVSSRRRQRTVSLQLCGFFHHFDAKGFKRLGFERLSRSQVRAFAGERHAIMGFLSQVRGIDEHAGLDAL
jgi:hypothetical protein